MIGLINSEEAAARAPEHHIVEIEDVGNLAAFLVSDAAERITGTIIPVDGGRICPLNSAAASRGTWTDACVSHRIGCKSATVRGKRRLRAAEAHLRVSVHVICAYRLHAAFRTTNEMEVEHDRPEDKFARLLALQELRPSATEMAEMQRRRFTHLLGAWKEPRDLRLQVALVALEDRRMAARRKILEELYRLDRLH